METLTSGPTRTATPTPGNPIHRENRNDAGTRQHNCATTPTKRLAYTFPVPRMNPMSGPTVANSG